MTVGFDVQIVGLKQLHIALSTLPRKLQINVMRGALNAGAKPFREELKKSKKFKNRSGLLRSTVRTDTRLDRKEGLVVANTGFGGKGRGKKHGKGDKAFYGRFLEFGTKAHVIKPKNKKALKIMFPRKKKPRFFAKVMHKGIKPKKIVREIFDKNTEKAIRLTAAYIRNRLKTKHGLDLDALGIPNVSIGAIPP